MSDLQKHTTPEDEHLAKQERLLAELTDQLASKVAVSGRTLVVGPGGYSTIGDAVAEARDGDTVLVRPGTYRETVTITRAITLRGDGDRKAIIVQFEGAECLVLHETTAAVTNMTFRKGGSEAANVQSAAILIDGGSPTLMGLELVEGRGIIIGRSGSSTIRGCVIRDGQQGGILVLDAAAGTIEANEIYGNASAGVLVQHAGTAPAVLNNLIRDGPDDGVYFSDGAGGRLENNRIFGNALEDIRVSEDSTPVLLRNRRS